MIDLINELKEKILRQGFRPTTVTMNVTTYEKLKARAGCSTHFYASYSDKPSTVLGLDITIDNKYMDNIIAVKDLMHDAQAVGCVPTPQYQNITIDRGDMWFKPRGNDSKKNLPKRYIVNADAGILFWVDGTKTVVKRAEGDTIDPVKAFLWAYFEKTSGLSKTKANKYLRDVEAEYIKYNCKPVEDTEDTEDTRLVFEKGKKYKVIDNSRTHHGFEIGEIVTCIDAGSGKCSDSNNNYYWLSERELEEIK